MRGTTRSGVGLGPGRSPGWWGSVNHAAQLVAMSGPILKDNELACAYLEAGGKSTAVLLDRTLDTHNPKTVYLFNLARGQILEYSREIVEPKLRALTPEEAALVVSLQSAYAEAKRSFRARGTRSLSVPEQVLPARAKAKERDSEDEEYGADADAGPVLGGDGDDADAEWEDEEG